MSDAARYAIYLAPEEHSHLARFVAGIIGYDAYSGADVRHDATLAFPAADWPECTSHPRRYGAHATLKAPFRLAVATNRDALATALETFASQRKVFDIGPLAISCLTQQNAEGFIALTNPHFSQDLHALAADTVAHFEPFRAPLTLEEIARRQPDRLSVRQRQHLHDFGYPFVKEDFTFHITLTNSLPEPEALADHLARRMAQEIGTTRFRVDALYLFEQIDREARFRVVGRFPLAT